MWLISTLASKSYRITSGTNGTLSRIKANAMSISYCLVLVISFFSGYVSLNMPFCNQLQIPNFELTFEVAIDKFLSQALFLVVRKLVYNFLVEILIYECKTNVKVYDLLSVHAFYGVNKVGAMARLLSIAKLCLLAALAN